MAGVPGRSVPSKRGRDVISLDADCGRSCHHAAADRAVRAALPPTPARRASTPTRLIRVLTGQFICKAFAEGRVKTLRIMFEGWASVCVQ